MSDLSDTQREIVAVCDAVKELLLQKNAAYGDSVMNPIRIFSRVSAREAICVRIDDKLSRLARGHALSDESFADTAQDLIGYLILDRIAEARERKAVECAAELDQFAKTLADIFPEPEADPEKARDMPSMSSPPDFSLYGENALFTDFDHAYERGQGFSGALAYVRELARTFDGVQCIVPRCATYPRALGIIKMHLTKSLIVTCCRDHAETFRAHDAIAAYIANTYDDVVTRIDWDIPEDPDV